MAATDEILGISGQMDISNIQASLDKLCDGLNRVGVDTDALSQRMTKALNDISKNDDELANKTQQAMQILKTAMDEATKGLQLVPEMIDTANKRVETIESSIEKLNERLQTTKDANVFNEISKQIESQKQILKTAKEDVFDLTSSYTQVKQTVSEVNGAYQALSAFSIASASANGIQSASNVAVSTTAAAATVATGAETVAHVANAAAANESAAAQTANAQATQQMTSSLREYLSVSKDEHFRELSTLSTKQLKEEIKTFEQSIKEIQEKLNSFDFSKNIDEATKAIERNKVTIEKYKKVLAESEPGSGDWMAGYNRRIQEAQAKIDELQSKIELWSHQQTTLNGDLERYNQLLDTARRLQNENTSGSQNNNTNIDNSTNNLSLSELSTKLRESKERLRELQQEVSKFNGVNLSDKQKEQLQQLQSEISQTKARIQDLKTALRDKNSETYIGRLINKLSDWKDQISQFGSHIKDKIIKPLDNLKNKISDSSFGKKLGAFGNRFGAEFEQVSVRMSEATSHIVDYLFYNSKVKKSLGELGNAFAALGIPAGQFLKSIKVITKAFWALCTTPIGMVLAAIAIGFKAIHSWLTKSAEGQKVMTRLMAYFGSLAKSVTDILVIFGDYLYKCFTEPNGPLRDFGINFVNTFKTAVKAVVNLIGGLGTTIKGIFNLDWDTFSKGLKTTWSGLVNLGDTILNTFKTSWSGLKGVVGTTAGMIMNDDFGKKLGAAFDGMFTKAEQAAKIAGKIKDTEIQIGQNQEKQLQLETKIADVRNKIYTLEGKEKIAAIEEAKMLIKQKYDTQIKQQQKLVELHEQNNKLHTKSLEDIKKERELRMQVLRTQVQQTSEQRMLTRQEAAAKRSLASKGRTEVRKEETQQKQIIAAEGKLDDVTFKNAYERVKALKSLEEEVEEARIKAMKEGEEKVTEERKRELDKEIEAIEEKKNAAVKAERDRQKAEFEAKQAIIKAEGGKPENWDDEKHLDRKNINIIESKYDTIETYAVNAYNNKIYEEEINSYRNYLKKYGDLERQKLAIVEEYSEKIREARAKGNVFEQAQLEKEVTEKQQSLDFEKFKESIDWNDVFNNLESHTVKYLEELRAKLKTLLDSGTLNIDDMKVVSEQMNKLNEAIDKQKSSWGIVNEYALQHKRLIEEAKEAQQELVKAMGERVSADINLSMKKENVQEKLSKNGIKVETDDVKYENKDKILSSFKGPKEELEKLKKAFDELGVAEVDLAAKTEKTTKAQNKANKANDTASLTMSKRATKLASGMQGVLDKIKDLPDLLDKIGLGNSGVGKFVKHGVEGLENGIGAVTDFAQGNYVGALSKGISAIQSFGRAFGIGGGNGREVAKKTKELTESNKRLQYSIEKLKNSIDKSSGMKAVTNYQKAYDAQKQINRQNMDILMTQMGYHGAHHSNSYYWNLGNSDYAAINRTLAAQREARGGYENATINRVTSLEDIYKLTPEQMADIRTYNQDIWKEMVSMGKYDKSEYWENYTDQAEKLEELTEKINQNLTQTSFSSLASDFMNKLMDMKTSAKDFADNFTTMLNQSMLNFQLSRLMDEKLNPLYKKWAAKMKDGSLTTDEIDDLKKEYDAIADEGLKIRDTVATITGYKDVQSEQTATSKAIEAITADQASSLIGIGYAMQIAIEKGNETSMMISADVSTLRGYTETIMMNVSEMRDMQFQSLEQLQTINKNTAPIILIREDISNMYKLMKERY